MEEEGEGEEGGQVSGVGEGGEERNRAHGPVAAQGGRT